jgi:hypothetical protein
MIEKSKLMMGVDEQLQCAAVVGVGRQHDSATLGNPTGRLAKYHRRQHQSSTLTPEPANCYPNFLFPLKGVSFSCCMQYHHPPVPVPAMERVEFRHPSISIMPLPDCLFSTPVYDAERAANRITRCRYGTECTRRWSFPRAN